MYVAIVCTRVWFSWIVVCLLLGLLWLYRPQLRMVLPFGYWKFSIRLGVSHWFIWTHEHIRTVLGLVNQSNSINVIEYPLSFIHYHLYYHLVNTIDRQMSIYVYTYEHIFMCQLMVYSWATYEQILMYALYALYSWFLVMFVIGVWLAVVIQLYFIKCILIEHINRGSKFCSTHQPKSLP